MRRRVRRIAAPAMAAIMALSLFAFAGCSDENPVDPDAAVDSDDTASIDDEIYWNEDEEPAFSEESAEGLVRMKSHSDLGVTATTRSYEIIVENLTIDRGNGAAQVFSPPVIASHNRSIRMFRVGRMASDELAGIAEDAMNQPMVDLLESTGRTEQIVVGDGVIAPGQSARYQIATTAGRRALSMAFMLVNTNDAFSGIDALRVPAHGEVEIELYAYDAGSELNDELESSIPGPCCGSVGTGTATAERIRHHAGIQGNGDLDPEVWGWDGPVARLTVRRLEPAYEITLRNLTPDTGDGGAQVFSPPVFASHGGGVRMFRYGRFASDELAGIAEDAMNQPMIELLERSGRAFDVQAGGGVIFPQNEDSFVIEAAPGFRRLSMAFMLVNTNDAFSGVDRLFLPRSGAVTYRLRAYDAGSEANDELMSSIPGPCCGNVGTGTETRERIRLHRGIRGDGDLSADKYGWDEPAAELTVVRVR